MRHLLHGVRHGDMVSLLLGPSLILYDLLFLLFLCHLLGTINSPIGTLRAVWVSGITAFCLTVSEAIVRYWGTLSNDARDGAEDAEPWLPPVIHGCDVAAEPDVTGLGQYCCELAVAASY